MTQTDLPGWENDIKSAMLNWKVSLVRLGGGHEIVGFPLTAGMARELTELNLVELTPDLLRRTLVVLSGSQVSCATLGIVLGANDAVAPSIEQIEAVRCWIDPWPNVGASPVAVINRISQWLA
jgi:hypothetical protein